MPGNFFIPQPRTIGLDGDRLFLEFVMPDGRILAGHASLDAGWFSTRDDDLRGTMIPVEAPVDEIETLLGA